MWTALKTASIADKFNVKGIPTLLVITPDQEEISRVVDYQGPEVMNQFFASLMADPVPLRELEFKAKEKNPEVLLRLGKRLLRRKGLTKPSNI